jgi:polyphosphate kinase
VLNLPRICQANIDRFFVRVVQPSLEQLPQHENVVLGEARSLDEFLDQCQKQVENHTANEARRSFAFALAAIFERQLKLWCRDIFSEEDHKKVNEKKFSQLLDQAETEQISPLMTPISLWVRLA